MSNSTEQVKVDLIESNFLTRRPCHVCGGQTGKVTILAEVTSGRYKGFRVCETCVRERDFDAKLRRTAASLQERAEETLSLVGRLDVPSADEWYERDLEHDLRWMRENGGSRKQIINSIVVDIKQAGDGPYAAVRRRWLEDQGVDEAQIELRLARIRRQWEAAEAPF